ncbi:YD repeat-containing protein [Nonlabens dokdonensis]|jgi:YD repeat-containing protein|uniref:YD repeat-containing protein n=2 Tax=Nonlabens dokdonensis TaxID=328515 RepID=L7WFR8_NONDD|nr:hypothetical protein [Nonlabens dokdonensis]AGC77758.1 hypothetical protein DDD_2631 [Nonlabens dokdonensis DSW-6]PZX39707.1 YD repeat-containing protein [Nonlabens dokdonensis]
MKKFTYLLLCLGLILNSCSDDDQIIDNTPLTPKLYRITQIVTPGVDGSATTEGYHEYEYGTNGFVSKIKMSGGGYHDFFYNSNDEIIRISFNGSNGNTYDKNYTYANGLIQSETYSSNGNTTTYEYDANDRLERKITSLNMTTYDYDTNNNVIRTYYDNQFGFDYQYDDKKNPSYDIFPVAYRKAKSISRNNTIARTDGVDDRIKTFQYGPNDYPVSYLSVRFGVYNDEHFFTYY